MHLSSLLCLFLIIPQISESRQCWGFSTYEYEGRIQKSDRLQIACPGDYCMTLSEEGSDFNVYNGTCDDRTVAITDCETNGVGCQKENIGGVYIKVCCCNSDLCNTSTITSLFYIILVTNTLYYLFTE